MSQDDADQVSLAGPGLSLRASLVPWDTRALGFPVAQIDDIELAAGEDPAPTIGRLVSWLEHNAVRLVSCRLDSLALRESMLLEELGFRFVEMVYSPVLEGLDVSDPADEDLLVGPATEDDRTTLESIASSVFTTGRHVLDWRLEENAGHDRYRGWLGNAMGGDVQDVLKVSIEGSIVGFFITERRTDETVYWHLTAIAPEAQGRGLGKRVWRCMIARHQADGARRIETTISAHNTPVINLYAGLGFRFTAPRSTFHWLR